MSTGEAVLALFEQVLNRYLALDPEAQRHLRPLHGKRILLVVRGFDLSLCLVPGPAGIQVFAGDPETQADCVLEGTPLGFARMTAGEGPEELFGGAVEIRGDTELAKDFGDLMRELDIDWEEQLSRFTGDVVAHQVGQGLRDADAWRREAGDVLNRDLGEYLQEEARLLPPRAEAEDFAADVDALRDDTERLEARIKRLAAHLSNGARE